MSDAKARFDIEIAIREQGNALRKIQTDLAAMTHRAKEAAPAVGGLVEQLKLASLQGAAFAVWNKVLTGVIDTMKSAIRVGIQFNATIEQQTIAFGTLLKSTDAARTRIKELTTFAAQTPFELEEVVKANRTLELFSKGVLSSADGMRLIGDAAAGTANNFQDVAFWAGRLYAGLESGTAIGEATLRLVEMGVISGDLKTRLDGLAESGVKGAAAWKIAADGFKRFAGAMQTQSRTFNGLMSTARDMFAMFSAEAMLPIFELVKSFAEQATRMGDALQSAGKWVGGFIRLLIDSFRSGTTADLLGLAFAAAIEKGKPHVEKVLGGLFSGNVVASTAKGIVRIAASIYAGAGSMVEKLVATIVDGISAGVRWIIDKALDMLNAIPNAYNKFRGKLNQLQGNPEGTGYFEGFHTSGKTFAQYLEEERAATAAMGAMFGTDVAAKNAKEMETSLLGLIDKLSGVNDGAGDAKSAFQQLDEQIRAISEAYDAMNARFEQSRQTTRGVFTDGNKFGGLNIKLPQFGGVSRFPGSLDKVTTLGGFADSPEEIKKRSKATVDAISSQIAAREKLIEVSRRAQKTAADDPLASNEEKQKRINAELTRQAKLIDEIVTLLRKRAALTRSPAEVEEINAEIEALEAEKAGLQKAGEAAPRGLARVREEMIAIRNAADSTFEVFMAGYEAMTAGIQGMITGAMSFRDAFRNMAQAVLAQIAQLIAQTIALKAATAVLGAFGLSPAPAALPGKASGGYSGDGPASRPAGFHHFGEFVLNAQATRALGLRRLYYMNRTGTLPGFASGGIQGALGRAADAGRGAISITMNFAAGITPEYMDSIIPEIEARTKAAVYDGLSRREYVPA